MKLQTFGVICSLGILFAPLSQSASTCNNCHNIDCSQSFGSYNQCYRNCCPSSPCESNCNSNECRSNCQMTACQSNCQTSECRSICQVSQCQSNCQSNLCKSNCEQNQNRCQSGSCYDYPVASQCSGGVPCDTPRPAPCSAAAPCSATTSPCSSSTVYVNGTSCSPPNITVNAAPNISLPKITVNIHQGAVHVGPIQVHNNFTLSCGNGTAPCSRPPRVVHVRVPHPLPPQPHPPTRIIYRWIPRPVAQQPVLPSPCCQYSENRCVNNVCYPQQVAGCGVQCAATGAPTQQCPWYGCQSAAAVAPCSTDACQPAVAPIEQPQLPGYGGGYHDAIYSQKLPQVLPQPVPETQTAYPQPLPEALPQPYPQPQPQPQPQPYPQPYPQTQPQPYLQPLPHHYAQPQTMPQPYPQPQPQPQPLPQPYPQPQPQPQPLPQTYPQPQPLSQAHPQPYPYQPQPALPTYPLTWESLPSNCIQIQQWPYFACQSEPYVDQSYYQGSYAAAFSGSYAPGYSDYRNESEPAPNETAKGNATLGVAPVRPSLPGTLPMRIIPKSELEESTSEESSAEYEDDQPESARLNVTRA